MTGSAIGIFTLESPQHVYNALGYDARMTAMSLSSENFSA